VQSARQNTRPISWQVAALEALAQDWQLVALAQGWQLAAFARAWQLAPRLRFSPIGGR